MLRIEMLIDLSWLDRFPLAKVPPFVLSWMTQCEQSAPLSIPLSSKSSHSQKVKVYFLILSSQQSNSYICMFFFSHFWACQGKDLFSILNIHELLKEISGGGVRSTKLHFSSHFPKMIKFQRIDNTIVLDFRFLFFSRHGGEIPRFSYHGRQHFILWGICTQRQKR